MKGRDYYDYRIKDLYKFPAIKTMKHSKESLSFRGSLLWNNNEIKDLSTVASLETSGPEWVQALFHKKVVHKQVALECSKS